jgi:hypothetical protein
MAEQDYFEKVKAFYREDDAKAASLEQALADIERRTGVRYKVEDQKAESK